MNPYYLSYFADILQITFTPFGENEAKAFDYKIRNVGFPLPVKVACTTIVSTKLESVAVARIAGEAWLMLLASVRLPVSLSAMVFNGDAAGFWVTDKQIKTIGYLDPTVNTVVKSILPYAVKGFAYQNNKWKSVKNVSSLVPEL